MSKTATKTTTEAADERRKLAPYHKLLDDKVLVWNPETRSLDGIDSLSANGNCIQINVNSEGKPPPHDDVRDALKLASAFIGMHTGDGVPINVHGDYDKLLADPDKALAKVLDAIKDLEEWRNQ